MDEKHHHKYDRDPHYKLMHDHAMDVFEHDFVIRHIDVDAFADLYVSEAADYFLTTFLSDAHAILAIVMCKSTAMRLFPLVSQSQQPDQSSKEDDQWQQLRKEFLVPLQKYYKRRGKFQLAKVSALNENLKPYQMIQKLFIFNNNMGPDFYGGAAWETHYEAIRTKFKDKGYRDDAVPHILFWDIWYWELPSIALPRPGVTLLRGWSNNLVKSFLENGGDIGSHDVMEATFSDKKFQAFAVVD
ncbi:hypothetical protein D8674_024996 [Pyrus ussuriensis x Pyrus communis]|uniref:DUF7788 domain-containing protein n=1 Tax=Pyrus ussuriensis x Pyrus communis TaxID=2448454 RepID=A0A5N5HHW8_9ROSA|nr:hypothetical protein D8674_024996 [Pyrus ussuriensis x Pyrus communis]